MLIQQAFSYMSQQVLPNMGPVVASAIGVDPGLVGFHTSLLYLASSISQLACGGFIIRYGALRMSQVSLVVIGIGLMTGAAGNLPLLALAAVVIGSGTALSTPASSHLLARYSPPRHAPLIFSVKQTGVPVGGLMAGTLVPFLLMLVDWRATFLATGALCLAFAIFLQPYRQRFDGDRNPAHRPAPGDILENLRLVLGTPALRVMAFAMFTFVGLQGLFGAYFVTLVTEGTGRPLETANHLFSIAMGTAIGARILWGWIGSTFLPARAVLAGLAVAMAIASLLTGFYRPYWSDLAIGAVAVLYCSTAVSWHGLFLSEVAKLAPSDKVGPVTGGVLAFGGAGMMCYPFVYAFLLRATGDYAIGFYIAGIPALIMGWRLLRPTRRAPSSAETGD